MPSSEFTPNNVWGSRAPEGTAEELTTPSGQTCAARRVSIPGLIEAGILTEADSLTSMASQYTTQTRKSGPDGPVMETVDQDALMRDPKAMKSIISLCEKAIPHIVVSPPVALHYTSTTVGKTTVTKALNDDERALMRSERPGLVFTDQITFEDKMFLFEWATGGLREMTPFRAESTPDVGSLAHGKKPVHKAKSASRHK